MFVNWSRVLLYFHLTLLHFPRCPDIKSKAENIKFAFTIILQINLVSQTVNFIDNT